MITFEQIPRWTRINVAIILVLALILLVQNIERDRPNTLAAPVIPDPVQRILIDDGREQLELIFEDGRWFVGKERYPGSTAAVERLIERVRGLPRLDIVTRRANLSEYGLAPEQAQRRTVHLEGAEARTTIEVGYTAASGETLFGRIDGGREVVRLPRAINNLVNTHGDDYREVVMGRIPAEQIRRIEIAAADHGVVTVTPGDPPGADDPVGAEGRTAAADYAHWRVEGPWSVAPGRVRDLLQELAAITAAAFPPSDVADTAADGTDPIPDPLAELTIATVNGGAGDTHRIRVAPPDGQGRFLVVATTSPYAFYLAEYRVRRLLLGIEAYLAPYMDDAPPLM